MNRSTINKCTKNANLSYCSAQIFNNTIPTTRLTDDTDPAPLQNEAVVNQLNYREIIKLKGDLIIETHSADSDCFNKHPIASISISARLI